MSSAETRADYNLRVLWPVARYLEDVHGADALVEVAKSADLEAGDFDGHNRWVSHEQFEAVLEAARDVVGSEEAYKRACAYRLPEAYGPLRFLLWATNPGAVFAQSAKQYKLVSTCGEMVIEHGRTWAKGHFKSFVPYSRLTCLLRQAQTVALPTLWGLPEAHLQEHACIARGDATCEFEARWYEGRRWLPVALGALAFALVGFLLVRLGLTALPTPIAMAIIGAVLGYGFEVRRTERVNDTTRQEVMKALQELANEEAEARRDLLDMHERQKQWTRLVEEEMSARTADLRTIVDAMKQREDASASTLLGFSHDLRNPLMIITTAASYLRRRHAGGDAREREILDELDNATHRMTKALSTLVNVTSSRGHVVTLAPQHIEIAQLTESLRRRLRALTFGLDIRTTVMATREVPESIEIDPVVLDRIVDNLLTNAAKYTERGSILVDLEGKPGFLVVKVSDTGRGIAPDALERVFVAGGSDPTTRRGGGLGVGLSVVVQLLEQIGGRLEVMSKPGTGTTFWIELPVQPPPPPSAEQRASAPDFSNVVKIRKVRA